MTTYHYDATIVWQLGPQGYVRGADSTRSLSLTDSTGAAVAVTQDGQTRGYIEVDALGRATFTAEVTSLTAEFGSGVITLYSREASNNTGDATLALSTAQAAQATADTAKTSADDSAAKVVTLQESVDGLSGQQAQLMGVAATIDELTLSVSMADAAEGVLWTAPFACTVVACVGVWRNVGGFPASDTDFITLNLYRRAAADQSQSLIVSKSTQASGGEAVTQWKPWDLAGSTWDATAQVFAAGDVLTADLPQVGSPGNSRPTLMVRYVPS